MALDDLQNKWEQRIDAAKTFREDDSSKPFQIEKGWNYYDGKQIADGWAPGEWFTINKIYSHIQAQLPTLYSIDPYFYVKVKKSYLPEKDAITMMEAKAKVRQAYLNYLKGETGLKSKARQSILDAHFDFGVIKVQYTSDFEDNEKRGKPIEDDEGNPLLDSDGEPIMEPDQLPINERYMVRRVHPNRILFDADAGPLEDDWAWIGELIPMTLEEAKADPTISNSALEGIEKRPKYQEDKDKQGSRSSLAQRVRNMVSGQIQHLEDSELVIDVYEIYDLKAKKWLKIGVGAKKPLMKPQELPPGVECHPYCILRFSLRGESPYPIPPVAPLLDPQREFNEARSRIMRHRKRFDRAYELLRSGIDPEEADKFEAGGDGRCVWVNQPGSINPVQDAQLDPQSYTEIGAINTDMVELAGTPDSARAIASATSPTEAALIDKRLEIREGDRLATVTDWVIEIGRKLDMLVQAHITEDEAIKISGPRGEVWEVIKSTSYEEIEGEYEYSVTVGATKPRLPQIERAQWLAFIQVIVQFPHLLTSERFMKKMAEWHGIEDERMVEELMEIGKQIMGGEMPMPGGGGSQQGVPEDKAITKMLGAALGNRGGSTNNPTSPVAAN